MTYGDVERDNIALLEASRPRDSMDDRFVGRDANVAREAIVCAAITVGARLDVQIAATLTGVGVDLFGRDAYFRERHEVFDQNLEPSSALPHRLDLAGCFDHERIVVQRAKPHHNPFLGGCSSRTIP